MTDEYRDSEELKETALTTIRRIGEQITESEGQEILDSIGDETNEISYLLALLANGGNPVVDP